MQSILNRLKSKSAIFPVGSVRLVGLIGLNGLDLQPYRIPSVLIAWYQTKQFVSRETFNHPKLTLTRKRRA